MSHGEWYACLYVRLCLCVCLLVMIVSLAQTTELIGCRAVGMLKVTHDGAASGDAAC